MAETAFVYILDVPYHADKPYEYYIPGEMRESVQPGVLVEVPFGGGNRKMTAVVRSLNKRATVDLSLKPIQSILGDGPVLSEEILALCSFVKEYTLCTYGDAVRAAVPGAALSKIVVYYTVTDPSADCSAMGAEAEAIFRLILAKKRMQKHGIRDAFDFDITKPPPKAGA